MRIISAARVSCDVFAPTKPMKRGISWIRSSCGAKAGDKSLANGSFQAGRDYNEQRWGDEQHNKHDSPIIT